MLKLDEQCCGGARKLGGDAGGGKAPPFRERDTLPLLLLHPRFLAVEKVAGSQRRCDISESLFLL
jgi:hypothetical protein